MAAFSKDRFSTIRNSILSFCKIFWNLCRTLAISFPESVAMASPQVIPISRVCPAVS